MSDTEKRLLALFAIKGVRWGLGALLLWRVWHHADWSVWLALVLIFFATECVALLQNLKQL